MSEVWARRMAVTLDVALVAYLLTLGWLLMPPAVASAHGPWWAGANDRLLYGPDSGEWAIHARAVFDGRRSEVDPHRLPTFLLLIALAMHAGWDVAVAGHAVNHALQLALPVVIYGLGRISGSRGAGLLAGVWVAIVPALVLASRRSGVDTTVAFLVPATLLTAWAAGRRWWFAPLAGVVAALTATSHLTAVAQPLPGLVMVALNGKPGWRRWASIVLYAATVWLVVSQILAHFPHEKLALLSDTVAEGIAVPHAQSSDPHSLGEREVVAKEVLAKRAPMAFDAAWLRVANWWRPRWFPLEWAFVVPWLGLFGPFLGTGSGTGWRLGMRRAFGGLATGLPITLALSPLLAFAAANSPERYGDNLLPVGALLIARGVATMPTAVERLVAWKFARWPVGITALVALGGFALRLASGTHPLLRDKPLRPEDREAHTIGTALASRYPAGIGAVCATREALGYAGMSFCPTTPCPFRSTVPAYEACVVRMRTECAGDGPIPFVILKNSGADLESTGRRAMNEWLADNLVPVAAIYGTRATLYELPRVGPIESAVLPPASP